MKAIPVPRGTGRSITVRVPSEHSRGRSHQFRWWSLDIEPHKELISQLRRTSAQRQPDVKRQWLTYLKSLDERQIATPPVARAAQSLWTAITRSCATAMPPNARPTEDKGLRMSWNRGGRYIEILIAPDGTFEWFYTDANDTYEGAENLALGEPLDRLLARLSDIF